MSATTPAIPEHLISLFDDIEYLNEAPPCHKLSLKSRNYADRTSYWDSFWRYIDGETGVETGEFVRKVTKELCQAINTYPEKKIHEILVSKALELRRGIESLIITYNRSPDVLPRLRTSRLILEMSLPDAVKTRHGIIHHDGSVGFSQDPSNDDEQHNDEHTD